MSINTILGHPESESLVDISAADGYATNHPAAAIWSVLSEAQKETLLVTASRHVAACPLTAPPLLTRINTPLAQGLPVPTAEHKHRFGTSDDGTSTTLVDMALGDYPDDLFNLGAVTILEGSGEGQWATVTDFEAATGTLSLSPAMTVAPDTTSRYLLIWPLPRLAQGAVIEQALHLAGGVNLDLLDEVSMGIASQSLGGDGGGSRSFSGVSSVSHLCHEARTMLSRAGLLNLDRSVTVGRG